MKFIYILITITIILCIFYNFNGNNKINLEFALKVRFANMVDIKESYWYSYLKLIYSDEQIREKLPFSMDDFWIIHGKLLPSNIILNNISNSPSKNKSLFTDLDPHVSSQKSVIYIYQYNKMPGDIDFCPNCISENLNKKNWGNSIPDLNFKLLKGFKNNTWVEIHRGPDKLNGYTWLYYMPGTGNWINLGKTIVFYDHKDAYIFANSHSGEIFEFIPPLEPFFEWGSKYQTKLGDYFKNLGYDTIQFTCRSEGIFKYEIFNIREKQGKKDNACLINSDIRTRGKNICKCNSSLKYLNCKVDNLYLPY